ncbi:MAG: PilZ domain-containing protein [Planctomycetota bacterium]
MPLKSLDGIQNALEGPQAGNWVFLALGFAVLAVLLLLIQVLVVRMRRQRRIRAAWQGLADRMARWQLDRQEGEVLRELARREAPLSPLHVVERPQVFETAVHRYLKRLGSSGSDAESVRRAALCVQSLRGKLRFGHRPGAVYYSTRQLAGGQQVDLMASGTDDPLGMSAKVKGGREDCLELTDVRPAPEGLRGRKVEVVFFHGKNGFSFETEVLASDPNRASCLLAHTLNVRSAGLRQLHRVEARGPVTFRAAWEEPDVRREGVLCDLSAGGLAMICPCYYETNEDVIVGLTPSAYLESERGRRGGEPRSRELKGTIVDTRPTEDGRCIHHVEFRDLDATDRQFLLGLVRRVEVNGKTSAAGE